MQIACKLPRSAELPEGQIFRHKCGRELASAGRPVVWAPVARLGAVGASARGAARTAPRRHSNLKFRRLSSFCWRPRQTPRAALERARRGRAKADSSSGLRGRKAEGRGGAAVCGRQARGKVSGSRVRVSVRVCSACSRAPYLLAGAADQFRRRRQRRRQLSAAAGHHSPAAIRRVPRSVAHLRRQRAR